MEKHSIPGSVGEFKEVVPLTTTAMVRPYIVAILLHRGAVKRSDVIAAISPLCPIDDLKVGNWDPINLREMCGTRLECVVDEALKGMSDNNVIQYNSKEDAYLMNPEKLTTIISWLTTLDARMPSRYIEEVIPWYARKSNRL
ncbi:MAG: hypothetical protein ACO24H_02335 [Polynucleobacter sp.]